ncbi:hypothetical protein N7455_009747 [Penicillium solitum]|uniref:uncharacterized protein n=1 Tax=Penicillium solitum TaxID=60172 RepID=UPI0032C3F2E4|nr:hypothetical protein N7455_009747 [Penicillium solitum]
MKTSFAAILSLAGAAFAAPATESQVNPYSIGDLSLKHTIEGDTWDLIFYLTSRSPAGLTAHFLSAPRAPSLALTLPTPSFFPTGAFNVEKYEVAAEGPAGTAVTFIESGYKYQCGPYTGSVGNVDTECKTINGGEFYLYQ